MTIRSAEAVRPFLPSRTDYRLEGGVQIPDMRFVPSSIAACCWLWKASRNGGGYGMACPRGRGQMYAAHRVIYELLVGPIPPGLEIDHVCRQRGCVNPSHLRPCTPRENSTAPGAKTKLAIQLATTRCPRGHAYDELNTYVWQGQRHCRICRHARDTARNAARSALRRREP